MSEVPGGWMPRERWDALVRGEGCPLCDGLASDAPFDDHGYVVADFAVSRLRLDANQAVRGYCLLICKKHVREPYDLSAEDQRLFFAELMRAGKALDEVFAPVKMNFEILGNSAPHLHCHLVPRYYGDPAPGRPINPSYQVRLLHTEEYEARVAATRRALGRERTG